MAVFSVGAPNSANENGRNLCSQRRMVAMPFFTRLPGRSQVHPRLHTAVAALSARAGQACQWGVLMSRLPLPRAAPLQASAGLAHLPSAEHRRDFAVSATVGHVSVSPDKAAARRRAKLRGRGADPFDYRFQSGHDDLDEVSLPVLAEEGAVTRHLGELGRVRERAQADSGAVCRCILRFLSPMSGGAQGHLFCLPFHLLGMLHPKTSISAAIRRLRCLPRQPLSRFRSRRLVRLRTRLHPDSLGQTTTAPPLPQRRLKIRKRRAMKQAAVIRRRLGLPSSISCHNISVEVLSTCSYESVSTVLP
jgi:hypothetical protein